MEDVEEARNGSLFLFGGNIPVSGMATMLDRGEGNEIAGLEDKAKALGPTSLELELFCEFTDSPVCEVVEFANILSCGARKVAEGFATKAAGVGEEVGIALAAKLSAFIISAAYRIMSKVRFEPHDIKLTFSATAYTTDCRCAAGIIGKTPASTTLRFCVPQTRRCGSTTPPCSIGSIASVPLG